MSSEEQLVEKFLASATLAANIIKETVNMDGFIHVFSHLDADGIAAAGILGKCLSRLDAKFRLRITQWVDTNIIEEIISDKPDLIILADFGSGYIDLLTEKIPNFKIVILDHHQVSGETENKNFTQVNPHLFGFDGATQISGSGVTYFVARELDKKNVDLSPIALVGALGDMQDRYEQRKLDGLNGLIVKDAVESKFITVEKDLIFFGRETRPIHKILANTTSPYLPGLSGKEDNSYAFLSNIGIKKEGETFRTLSSLSEDEKKRLCDELGKYLLSKGLHYEVTNLIGHIYILNKEKPSTYLRDAREFAVVLNSTGRMNRPSIGIAICMGDRDASLEEANKILEDYRRDINKYINWVMEKPDRLKELDHMYVINGEDFVSEKMIGTISSILITSLPKIDKPLIAYAKVPDEDIVKFSARTTDPAVKKGVNLGDVMRIASEKLDGKGGGHNIAAGAQTSTDKVDDFIVMVNTLIGEQLLEQKI